MLKMNRLDEFHIMKMSFDRCRTVVLFQKLSPYTERLILREKKKKKEETRGDKRFLWGKKLSVHISGNLWGTFILILEVEGRF